MATILVVEDNPQNLKLAQLLLQKGGHSVIAADNAEAGILLAQEEKPALVLMDVQMPGMDGLTATRHLREDARTRDIKVVALTALAMKGDAERILAAGCDAYLAKPFQYNDLMSMVNKVLGSPA
jgi:two-component system cell cycle response regulator DivK